MEKESKTDSDNVKDNTNSNNANDPRNQLNFNSILNTYSINPFINPNIYQAPINNTPFIYPLYNFLKNAYKWIPKYLTFDFGGANIKAINDTLTDKEDITIMTCLFHLMQY